MTPRQWLASFLDKKDLHEPDGRMLYEYHLAKEEYESLRKLITEWASDELMSSSGHLPQGLAESFVLFGANWWQREYSGGSWRWDDVLHAFGASPEYWPANFRSEVVATGLRFWKQSLGTIGKRYFAVLVEQGGLPAVLLANSQGNISRLMRVLLGRTARLGAGLDEVAAMAADYDLKLPVSLRNPTVHMLIAKVVTTVLELKREFKLSSSMNAVEMLDVAEPQWRARFPIALDDNAAAALLRELVTSAAALDVIARTFPVFFERYLVEHEGSFSIVSKADLPKTIDGESLAGLLAVQKDELPFRFSLEIETDKRAVLADVRKLLGSDPMRYQFSLMKTTWTGESALREHMLSASLRTGSRASIAIPGAMELNESVPWVFAARDEECRLIGQGSCRVREDCALLVLDEGWIVDPCDEDTTVTLCGRLSISNVNKVVLRLCGVAAIRYDTMVFRIQTNQAGAEPERFAWEGHRLEYARSPSLGFYGVPKLVRYPDGGERKVVPPQQLEWRTAGTQHIIKNPALARGPVDVVWRIDGEVGLRSRMLLLDKDAPIRFRSSVAITEGTICVPSSWEAAAITCNEPMLETTVDRTSEWLSLKLSAAVKPPESVPITVDWRGSLVACSLVVPFPASGGRFFDSRDQSLAENATVLCEHLLGMRLSVFDGNPQQPRKHQLQISLEQASRGLSQLSVIPVRKDLELLGGRLDARLIDFQDDIESFLGLASSLDDYVAVTLLVGGRRTAEIRVKRYETKLVRKGSMLTVSNSSADCDPHLDPDEYEIMAVPVGQIHESAGHRLSAQILNGHALRLWELPSTKADALQWMVYPSTKSRKTFRPMLADLAQLTTAAPTVHASAPTTFRDVLLLANKEERLAFLVARLKPLQHDFFDPEWESIEGIWSNLGHLNLSSIDVWTALARCPGTLAAFAFRIWNAHSVDQTLEMCTRFQHELGVVWEMIPLACWRLACRQLAKQWEISLPRDLIGTMVVPQVVSTLERMRQQLPSLNTILALVEFQECNHAAATIAPLATTPLRSQYRRLWDGMESAVQDILLRDQLDRAPPGKKLLRDFAELPDQNDEVLDRAAEFVWVARDHPRIGVANVPIVLALCVCHDIHMEWWHEPTHAYLVQECRAFNRAWFGHAFNAAVEMLIAARLIPTK